MKKAKASKSFATPKASRVKPLESAPPESGVQSEDMSCTSMKTKKISGQGLTPASILHHDEYVTDLYCYEDLADDALELLLKRKQEAEIFRDLPLFDVDIMNNFIGEWFEDTSLNIDDL